MIKSQNTKDEQQKDLCITSEQLTELWKKGELLEDLYYVRCAWSDEIETRYVHNGVDDWQEIIAKVPSYEEWQQLKEYEQVVTSYNFKPIDYDLSCRVVTRLLDEKKGLRQKNTKLKELLDLNNVLNIGSRVIYARLKENTAGEQNKLYTDMFNNTEKMIIKINQVLGE